MAAADAAAAAAGVPSAILSFTCAVASQQIRQCESHTSPETAKKKVGPAGWRASLEEMTSLFRS